MTRSRQEWLDRMMAVDSNPLPQSSDLRVTARDRLRGLAVICGVGFVLSSLGLLVLFVTGFIFFNAKESDLPWFYPVAGFVSIIWLGSALGLVGSGVGLLVYRGGTDQRQNSHAEHL